MNPTSLKKFLSSKIKHLGTAACPPYHIGVTVGGLSAELNLKTTKYATARYYDDLYTTGNEFGRAFRDIELENEIKEITEKFGIGA